MSREIKFRAWDSLSKYMLPSYEGWISMEGDYYDTPDKHYDTPNIEIEKKENFILMQYTGLKDKLDKKIYEGDIVEYDSGMENLGKLSGNYVVRWNNSRASFEMFSKNADAGKEFTLFFEDGFNDFEIIGNIFENPEQITIDRKKYED